MLGHDGPPTWLWRENLLTGEPLARCPLRSVQLADRRLVAEVRRHRDVYHPPYEKHGTLIEPGGLADQPARSVDMLLEIDHLEAKSRRRYEELRPKDAGE